MGSIVPFQDLNLAPSPFPSAAATTPTNSNSTLLTPKIEPKLEPLDEPLQILEPPTPLNPPDPPEFSFSDSTPTLFPNSQHTPLSQSSEQDNVYSEFFRISELFRTAFAKRSQSDGDVDDSRAIVPVNPENQVSTTAVAKRKYEKRSSELVRVTNVGVQDEKHFRDVFRGTRMLYDALRILTVFDEERRSGLGRGRRSRGDLRAASLMRERGLWINRDKRIVGQVPGVQIGDIFFFRMELMVVGLHGHSQAGIDYLSGSHSSNGEPIATSIVVSGGYEDDEDAGDVLIYTGHGGQDKLGRQCEHQRLEGGNLALERSMHYGIEIRVIRGFKYERSVSTKIYVYDGLYKVHDCWFDVGKSGFGVYKFKLVRIEGQPEMGSSILRLAQNLRTKPVSVRPRGYISLDMSNKKENVPILLFNDIDSDYEPLFYDYLVKTVFPPFVFNQGGNGGGCDCVGGCTDGCYCAMKNGGEFAYDYNGSLLRGKPVIFECGTFCKCPPSCRNRVTQKGLASRLEVFRSRETGWGVRSLDLIHAGDFICEFTGVVLTMEQAQILSMNGDTMVHPNRFSTKWVEWGDLQKAFPEIIRPNYPSLPPLDFAMDVSRMRNVACYMSHSPSPNVMVQFVLYDHNNLMFPHLMLFAMENIPPLRELSLDYGVTEEWTGKLSICN